jgi:OOP family OmpA-OmpF porin
MRKKILAVLLFSPCVFAQNSSPLDHSWYVGGNVGWSSFHADSHFAKGNSDALGTAGFLGYQFSPWFSAETGYNLLGSEDGAKNRSADIMGWQLSGKFSYPINQQINVYTRLGGMLYRNDISDDRDNSGESSDGVAPLVTVGAEYYLGGHWTTRLEYQWLSGLGGHESDPDNGYLSVGVTYHFMQPASHAIVMPVAAAALPAINVPTAQSDSGTVFFDYNSVHLNAEQTDKLKHFYQQEIVDKKYVGMLSCKGGADTIGSTKNNEKVATRRSQNVRDYLIGLGVAPDKINAISLGETHQFDKAYCGDYSTASQKKACEAGNRRVDIVISQ